MEEMYKRTLQEVGSLKEQLGGFFLPSFQSIGHLSFPLSISNSIFLTHTFSLFLLFSSSGEAERKEYARQSRASEEVMRVRVAEVRDMVHEEQISKKEIASGDYFT